MNQKFHFHGDLAAVTQGLKIIAQHLKIVMSKDGADVTVVRKPGDIYVEGTNNRYTICYDRPIHFFRAVGLLIEQLHKGEQSFLIQETPQFDHCGIMPDLARSTLLSVSAFKKTLTYMALMGLDELMLYLQESFVIPDEPYFGYMAGQYSYEELKDLDDFADSLGISLYPAIQTLGHLENFLRWSANWKYRDKGAVLLVEDEQTEKLIRKILHYASAPFRSKKINIGMDETFDLGRGAYEIKHGQSDLFELYYRHLRRVTELARDEGLEPQAWGDMILMEASSTQYTWNSDLPIPERTKASFPSGLTLAHWDYYSHDKQRYIYYISKLKQLTPNLIFVGGIWNWTSMVVNQSKTISTSNVALQACKELQVRQVLAAIWGNAYNFGFFGSLLGMQLYAEHAYHKELNMEVFKKRLEFTTGVSYDSFMILDQMENFSPRDCELAEPYNVSYCLMFQDILLGLFDADAVEHGFADGTHYAELAQRIAAIHTSVEMQTAIFDFPQAACEALAIKADLGIRLKKAYDIGDCETLRQIAEIEIPELDKRIREMRRMHIRMWEQDFSAFGFEEMDERYGHVLCRLDSAQYYLRKYLTGKDRLIPQLEQQRLPYFTDHSENALYWALEGIVHPRCRPVV